MALADWSDYVALHGIPDDPSVVEAQLARASAQIASMCNQTLERATSTIEIVGTWKRFLPLPEWPVVSVASVAVNGVTVTGFEVSGTGILWPSSSAGRNGATGGFPGNWGGPDCLVAVTYTHGFDPIPDDLRNLCVDMAAVALTVPVGARTTSTSLGSYQEAITYDLRGDATRPQMSAVINRYRR